MKAFLPSILSAVLLSSVSILGADDLDVWRWRNPVPTANSLFAAGFGANRFVVAGELGTAATSVDGLEWITANTGVTNTLNAVTFGSNLFVIVGDGGTILSSDNGLSWTARNSGTTNRLSGVAHGNGTFVAVGSGGTAVISTDATNWSVHMLTNSQPLEIAFGNNLFVATTTSNSFATTVDGAVWTTAPSLANGSLSGVVYGNGTFLAGGDTIFEFHGLVHNPVFWTSTNGVNWSQQPTFDGGFGPRPLTYGNGLFVSVGAVSAVATSTNASTWSVGTNFGFAVKAAAAGDGIFILAGEGGRTWRSSDGVNWSGQESSRDLLTGIQYANGVYVAIGGFYPNPWGSSGAGPTLLVSTNGLSFAPASVPISEPLSSIAVGNGLFIVAGQGGALYRSTDGLTWVRRGSGTLRDLHGIAHGNGMFVAVGEEGTIATSPEGLVWTLRFSGSAYPLYDVAYVNGLYVVVGYYGTILTSPDAITWTAQYTDAPGSLFRVAGGNGLFVAAGQAGTILTSRNGIDWTSSMTETLVDLYGLAFGSEGFLAAGGNVLLSSTDGVNWTRHNPVTNRGLLALLAVEYLNGNYWLAGDTGTILESGTAMAPRLFGQWDAQLGTFELSSTGGKLDVVYRLQNCTNMAGGTWSDLRAFTNSPAGMSFIDRGASLRSKCFYRLTSP